MTQAKKLTEAKSCILSGSRSKTQNGAITLQTANIFPLKMVLKNMAKLLLPHFTVMFLGLLGPGLLLLSTCELAFSPLSIGNSQLVGLTHMAYLRIKLVF